MASAPKVSGRSQHGPLDPKALRALRKQAADTIERLLAFLDDTEGDPDLEEAGDLEPSLGGHGSYHRGAYVGLDLEADGY